jgi:hypothetical protein
VSGLGRVPPFRSELDFELSGLEVDVLPSLNETRIWLIEVEIDLGRGDGTCGVPCELDGFRCVDSGAEGGESIKVSSAQVTG